MILIQDIRVETPSCFDYVTGGFDDPRFRRPEYHRVTVTFDCSPEDVDRLMRMVRQQWGEESADDFDDARSLDKGEVIEGELLDGPQSRRLLPP